MFICFSKPLSLHDHTPTADIITHMFEELMEYAVSLEEENEDYTEAHDGGIGVCCVDSDKMDTNSEKEKNEQEYEKKTEDTEDELLTFPPNGILSPLSKSVEAVVTPLVRLYII